MKVSCAPTAGSIWPEVRSSPDYDSSVFGQIREVGDARTEAVVLTLSDGAWRVVVLKLPEVSREGDLLLIRDILAAKHEHRIAIHAGLDRRRLLAADRSPQIDARHFGGENRMELSDCQGHGDHSLRHWACDTTREAEQQIGHRVRERRSTLARVIVEM